MTEVEAIAEAAKRELHKSKHLKLKVWAARHDSIKGWHPALVDNQKAIAAEAMNKAHNAAQIGDLEGFINNSMEAMFANVKDELAVD